MTIYIAEDEKNIRHLITVYLEKENYTVHAFENGDLLYDAFLQKPCNLVILDVMMPGSNGFIICTKLRAISKVPIIMLTARDTEEDYVSGITLGSDDYFTKPFSPVKLVMRVKAMLRRVAMDTESKLSENTPILFADISMDPDKLIASVANEPLQLTNTEFSVLMYLIENKDKAVAREELLNKIWGYDTAIETRATDAAIKRLRKKLIDANSKATIDTIWGHGFRII